MPHMNRRDFGRTGLLGVTGFALPGRVLGAQGAGSNGFRYVHLDVFTDRRLQGNQLFVFLQPAGLDTDTMQTMTRESNLSECTFVFPPETAGTDHRVRIFTRTAETPFAGHPTIGTAFALAHAGVLKPGLARTTFGLGAGLAAALGVDAVDRRAPAQEVNCGSNFFIVPLQTRKAVDAAVIDRAKAD